MGALIARLIERARSGQVVLSQPLQGDLQLLVYPSPDGVLLALGFARDSGVRVDADAVLRKRSAALARYGAWLPAMLSDGSWYVVRRFDEDLLGAVAPPSEQDLQVAGELLA